MAGNALISGGLVQSEIIVGVTFSVMGAEVSIVAAPDPRACARDGRSPGAGDRPRDDSSCTADASTIFRSRQKSSGSVLPGLRSIQFPMDL
jgi:hypothetical protein